MTPIEQMKFRCAELAQAIAADVPGFKTILQDIHTNIRETPELAYALSDEEIAVIIGGLSKFTGVEIAAVKKKETISKTKAAKLTDADV